MQKRNQVRGSFKYHSQYNHIVRLVTLPYIFTSTHEHSAPSFTNNRTCNKISSAFQLTHSRTNTSTSTCTPVHAGTHKTHIYAYTWIKFNNFSQKNQTARGAARARDETKGHSVVAGASTTGDVRCGPRRGSHEEENETQRRRLGLLLKLVHKSKRIRYLSQIMKAFGGRPAIPARCTCSFFFFLSFFFLKQNIMLIENTMSTTLFSSALSFTTLDVT